MATISVAQVHYCSQVKYAHLIAVCAGQERGDDHLELLIRRGYEPILNHYEQVSSTIQSAAVEGSVPTVV